MDIDMGRDRGEKVQLGISGTSMPNEPKNEIRVLYILDRHNATLGNDIGRHSFKEKVQDKFDGEPRIGWERSGGMHFDEQAIIVTLRGDSLPVQQSQINRAANTIENHFEQQDFPIGVKAIFMDTI